MNGMKLVPAMTTAPTIDPHPMHTIALPRSTDVLDANDSMRTTLAAWFLAILISGGFFAATHVYWLPSAGGVDQNGYLLGGLMIARHHAGGIALPDPFVDLGPHWVMVGENRFALKFPVGLPALYAIIRRVGGSGHWATASHLVSPLCASLALLGCYALFKPIIGRFFALGGVLVLSSSPVTMVYANTPNSHAMALCAVTWGMAMLFRWQRRGGIGVATGAGALLGYAATIRYTEGLLIVPIALVLLQRFRGDRYGSVAVVCAWAAPVIALLAFNLVTIGHLNGYALTNESTAFSLHYFFRNAALMANSLDQVALRWIVPIALLGGLIMLCKARPLALVLWTWAGGSILLYTAYYWSSQTGVTYLRFVLTAFPAIILAAMWLLQRMRATLGGGSPTGGWFGTLVAGAIVATSASLNLLAAAPLSEQNHWNDLQCRIMDEHMLAAAPRGSTIFTQRPNIPHLEVAGDWRFYLSNAFTPEWVGFLNQHRVDSDAPQILQPQRAAALYAMLKNASPTALVAMQNQLIVDSVKRGQAVYAVLPKAAIAEFVACFLPAGKFETQIVDQWDVDPRSRAAPADLAVESDGAETSATADPGAPAVMEIVKITPRRSR
jgi:hypothetical protein